MRPTGHSGTKRRVGDPLRRASLGFDDVYFEASLTIEPGNPMTGTRWTGCTQRDTYISDPTSKAKSVVLNAEAVKRARELFEQHFGR